MKQLKRVTELKEGQRRGRIELSLSQEALKSGKKKEHKIKFLGPDTARWGGGLPREGVVAESFVPSVESLSSLGFEGRSLGCPEILAGMSRTPGGVQKVCAKKVRAHFSLPIKGGHLRMGFRIEIRSRHLDFALA